MTSYRDYLDGRGVAKGPWVVTPVDGRALREPALVATLPEPASGLVPTGDDPARVRPCTCHPDDRPSGPCRQRFAASECREAAELIDWITSDGTRPTLACAKCGRRTPMLYHGLGFDCCAPSDSDGPRMAETNEDSARGEAGPARAEGIAQGQQP